MKQTIKVAKSAKTKLSDLTPKKDARGGVLPQPTPPVYYPPKATDPRRPIAAYKRPSTV
jgi:hypothetical protein